MKKFTHHTPFGILILILLVKEDPRTTKFILSPNTFLSTGAKVSCQNMILWKNSFGKQLKYKKLQNTGKMANLILFVELNLVL